MRNINGSGKYTRIIIHGKCDKKGNFSHTRFWMTDYCPRHPDGEFEIREVGQCFNTPPPIFDKDTVIIQDWYKY